MPGASVNLLWNYSWNHRHGCADRLRHGAHPSEELELPTGGGQGSKFSLRSEGFEGCVWRDVAKWRFWRHPWHSLRRRWAQFPDASRLLPVQRHGIRGGNVGQTSGGLCDFVIAAELSIDLVMTTLSFPYLWMISLVTFTLHVVMMKGGCVMFN